MHPTQILPRTLALLAAPLLAASGCSDTFTGTPVGADGSSTAIGWSVIEDGPHLDLPSGAPLSPRSTPPNASAASAATTTPEFTLVNVWASTCGPCRREMPVLNELVGRDDLRVVGVSRDQFARYAREFEDEVDAAFASWLDSDGTWTEQLSQVTTTFALPVSVLVRNGHVVSTHLGEIEDAAEVVDQLAAQRAR